MTNPQTEARAIVAAEGDDVEWFHPDDVVRMITTALAAKDAELADLREQNERQEATIVRFNSRAERAEAQLAERAAGATHRHKKRGTEYVLIGYGKMQTEAWFEHDGSAEDDLSVDMRSVAIYRSVDDGSLWVRPREEFEDGRFEALTAEPAAPEPKTLVHEPMVWTGEGPYGFSPASPEGRQEAVAGLAADEIPRWPPLKKTLWDVVTGENLNDGHYINAYELTDKLYEATRPAEQAVTEAQIEAEARKRCYAICSTGGFLDFEAGCCAVCTSEDECQGWRALTREARIALEAGGTERAVTEDDIA